MASYAPRPMPELTDTALIEDLTPEQRAELELRTVLRVGKDLVWIELDGRVSRAPVSNVYYVQTERGVFRVSRLSGEVVEV